jgi:L-seryl-tRNA(Ser) seleniumtransferase
VETVSTLRQIPSVDQILQAPQTAEWIAQYGRPLTVSAIRYTLDQVRTSYRPDIPIPDRLELLRQIENTLQAWAAPSLIPVINASGVILHTNLGRAPLSRAAVQAAQEVSMGYSNLEYDLNTGRRGSRLIHTEALLCRITGAEAALVVNNNAAAVLLILTALARRRAVVIARSQLVEIGGGFRVPDVMKQSGARLLEIGTTNRVHLSDYEAALEEKPALFLRAHRSNFRIQGFTSEPSLAEIVALAHQAGVMVVDDLGSGALLDTTRYGLAHEPMVQESQAAGGDLICFSGDKLLGGPQAGIIIGRAEPAAKLKQHPLARAVRADKLCLAALSATLLHYLKDEAEREIPIWGMLAASAEQIRYRATAWAAALGQGEVIPGESTIGGGSLPGETLPTFLLAFNTPNPNHLIARLHHNHPPIIARLQDNRLVIDPRTILVEQESSLLAGLQAILK